MSSTSTLSNIKKVDRRFSVAPMLDYTDRYCRYFHRLLTQQSLLYTEMITSAALLHGDSDYHLRLHEAEHPIALQLGGSNPEDLAHCAKLATNHRYDEINLNCGCPSDRVQSGCFGAILMRDPALVANCFDAMQSATEIPVTIKHRTGIDAWDSYEFLRDFVGTVANAGCKTFIVHARKAWLQGLSPKQNREIPPLQYERVYQLKKDFPRLEIIINGGVTSLNHVEQHLEFVDGVMMGREAYHNPYLLAEVDNRIFKTSTAVPSRTEVIEKYIEFAALELASSARLSQMTRHILGLFHGRPGARKFRRYISENAHKPASTANVIYQALAAMQPSTGTNL